jgi:hypothetical protein
MHPTEVAVYGFASICSACASEHPEKLGRFVNRNPTECEECHTAIKDLPEIDPAGNVRMYMHMKDGELALLCEQCSRQYTLKRRDLYGGTPWMKRHTGEE